MLQTYCGHIGDVRSGCICIARILANNEPFEAFEPTLTSLHIAQSDLLTIRCHEASQ